MQMTCELRFSFPDLLSWPETKCLSGQLESGHLVHVRPNQDSTPNSDLDTGGLALTRPVAKPVYLSHIESNILTMTVALITVSTSV